MTLRWRTCYDSVTWPCRPSGSLSKVLRSAVETTALHPGSPGDRHGLVAEILLSIGAQ